MEKMIIQMQEMLSHLSEDVANMSDEIYTQQKEIRRLSEKLAIMEARLKSATQGGADIRPLEEETPPPHY